MQKGYRRAYEKEGVLAIILMECYDMGDLHHSVATKFTHPSMISDGLIYTEDNHATYKLTDKSIELLYRVYGKVL